MARHPNQYVVLSFPRPRPSVRLDTDWIRIVLEADWMFHRLRMDTIEIANSLGLPEADALRAVIQGREARRK